MIDDILEKYKEDFVFFIESNVDVKKIDCDFYKKIIQQLTKNDYKIILSNRKSSYDNKFYNR